MSNSYELKMKVNESNLSDINNNYNSNICKDLFGAESNEKWNDIVQCMCYKLGAKVFINKFLLCLLHIHMFYLVWVILILSA